MPIDVANNIGEIVGAVGGLGLASYALVDATKAGAKGGVSNSGFKFIEFAIKQLLPNEARTDKLADAVQSRTLLDILHANWIGGMALSDQKAVAKSLIKLRLTPKTAAQFATATNVAADLLTIVATKMSTGDDLSAAEVNVLGRFDLALTALLDEGCQRADQKYRNTTRVFAMMASIVIAIFGGWAVSANADYFASKDLWIAFICGLLATPLAPISKDLASALQAGVKVAQATRK